MAGKRQDRVLGMIHRRHVSISANSRCVGEKKKILPFRNSFCHLWHREPRDHGGHSGRSSGLGGPLLPDPSVLVAYHHGFLSVLFGGEGPQADPAIPSRRHGCGAPNLRAVTSPGGFPVTGDHRTGGISGSNRLEPAIPSPMIIGGECPPGVVFHPEGRGARGSRFPTGHYRRFPPVVAAFELIGVLSCSGLPGHTTIYSIKYIIYRIYIL